MRNYGNKSRLSVEGGGREREERDERERERQRDRQTDRQSEREGGREREKLDSQIYHAILFVELKTTDARILHVSGRSECNYRVKSSKSAINLCTIFHLYIYIYTLLVLTRHCMVDTGTSHLKT